MTENTQTVRLYVPEDVAPRAPYTHASEVHERVRAKMCEHAGGCTEWSGVGSWENDDGEVVREDVRVYEAACTNAGTLARYLASTVALATDETEVRAEITPVDAVETVRAD